MSRLRVALLVAVAMLLASRTAAAVTSPACVSAPCSGSTACNCTVPACEGNFTGSTIYYACDCEMGTHAGNAAPGCVQGSDGNTGTSQAQAFQTYSALQAKFGSLQPGDRIEFCRGGMFTVGASSRFVNNNSTALNPVVITSYLATWAGGVDPGPATINIPSGSSGFDFDDGSDTVQNGVHISGISLVGDGSDTVNGNSIGIFGYNQINFVRICDIWGKWTNIPVQTAGGNADSDHNTNWTILNSYFEGNGGQGFLGGDNNFTLRYSYFVNNGFDRATFNHNIYIAPPSHNFGINNIDVSYNELTGATLLSGQCSATELVMHGIVDTWVFGHNYIHEPSGGATEGCYGIGVVPGYTEGEMFSNGTINANTIVDVGGNGINIASSHGCSVTNNVVSMLHNICDVGITGTNDGVVSPDWSNQNLSIEGNSVQVSTGIGVAIVDSILNGVAANNAAYTTQSGGTISCFNYNQPTADYTFIDNNDCYGPAAGTLNWNPGTTFASWKSATGFDTHSLNAANPQWTSPATINFYPLAGSPLIGAGNFAHIPTTDQAGQARPNPPTIGALEPLGSSTGGAVAYYKWGIILLFISVGAAIAVRNAEKKRRQRRLADPYRFQAIAAHLDQFEDVASRLDGQHLAQLEALDRDD
jgi:hypothetical protein